MITCRICLTTGDKKPFFVASKEELIKHYVEKHGFTEENAAAFAEHRLDDIKMFDIDPPKKQE